MDSFRRSHIEGEKTSIIPDGFATDFRVGFEIGPDIGRTRRDENEVREKEEEKVEFIGERKERTIVGRGTIEVKRAERSGYRRAAQSSDVKIVP